MNRKINEKTDYEQFSDAIINKIKALQYQFDVTDKEIAQIMGIARSTYAMRKKMPMTFQMKDLYKVFYHFGKETSIDLTDRKNVNSFYL